jgi:hypothetical protein
MSLDRVTPQRLTTLLVGLSKEQVLQMSAVERQALSDQCQRLYRIIETERVVDDAKRATSEEGGVFRQAWETD